MLERCTRPGTTASARGKNLFTEFVESSCHVVFSSKSKKVVIFEKAYKYLAELRLCDCDQNQRRQRRNENQRRFHRTGRTGSAHSTRS